MEKDYVAVETDWAEIPAESRERLILTGYAALNYQLEGDDPSEADRLVAYTTIEEGRADIEDYQDAIEKHLEFPEGEQEIYLLQDDYPSSYKRTSESEINLPNPDVLIKDIIIASPRLFNKRVNNDDPLRQFMRNHLSREKKKELVDRYGDHDYIGDEIQDLLR